MALVLPLRSRSMMLAAAQVVIYFMRAHGRIELDLLQHAPPLRIRAGGRQLTGTLFLSSMVRLPADTPETRAQLDAEVRSEVERRYARYGITQVSYDLQLI
ncbi:MAG TPA: hypothetical protein VFE37_26375 [Chloroflexota bacterium]|nr:hypothetical protein [Chloroflexota bacterium]